MRCTRCDRPVIPQAVGLTPEGVVVFGWCVACLKSSDCDRIVVARRSRRRSTRLVLETWTPRPRRPVRPRSPLDDRRLLVSSVALVLALWGFILFSVGLLLWSLGLPRARSPLGNGTPALLIGGGGSTTAVGLILWAISAGHVLLGARLSLKVVQVVGFVTAAGTLLAGIAFRNPHRDTLVVGLASAGLTVSAAARWIESRRSRTLAGTGR